MRRRRTGETGVLLGSDRRKATLFDAAGTARRLAASPLLAIGPAAPGPALRRGALLAIPVGAVLLVELGLGTETAGSVATGALLAGFAGMDAPAAPRAAWEAATAPLLGLAAALGALTAGVPVLAVLAAGLVAALGGYCYAVSLRLSIVGLNVALAVVIAQGLPLDPGDAPEALLYVTAGGLLQAAFSLVVWLAGDRAEEGGAAAWNGRAAVRALAANLTLGSISLRHGLRFGGAIAVGVATYRALGIEDHGFWIPLTILFVLRPEEGETMHRLALRAAGTALGLLAATGVSEALGGAPVAVALALAVAAALSYGLLTVQYALFTAAITVYAVVLAGTLGEGAWQAAHLRALGTAIGIAIAGGAFLVWSNPAPSGRFTGQPANLAAGAAEEGRGS